MLPRAASAGPLTGHASICQPSTCSGRGGVHFAPSSRVTWMSRTSRGLRSRNATTGPSSVMAAVVWQHSQTRVFTTSSAVCFHDLSKRAKYKPIEPPSGPDVFSSWSRPSSQTMPSPVPGISKSVAKPCCVIVPSWCGAMGRAHVMPSSRE
ncbi:hypothetical protein D3C83_19810 [compost metagenome]